MHVFRSLDGRPAIAGGKPGLFGRKDGGDFEFAGLFLLGLGEAIVAAKFFSNRQQKCVPEGSGQVIDLNLSGICSSPGAAAGDYRDVQLAAGCQQVALGADRVDGIDESVGSACQKGCRVGLGVERLLHLNIRLWVDDRDPFGEGLSFGLADCFGSGVNLPVGVRDAEVVEIDKSEFADAGAGQGLGSPRAYTTEPDDHDVALGKGVECQHPIKAANAPEAIEKVVGHAASYDRHLD